MSTLRRDKMRPRKPPSPSTTRSKPVRYLHPTRILDQEDDPMSDESLTDPTSNVRTIITAGAAAKSAARKKRMSARKKTERSTGPTDAGEAGHDCQISTDETAATTKDSEKKQKKISKTGKKKDAKKKATSSPSVKGKSSKDGNQVSKTGKPLKDKKTVGNQPSQMDEPPVLSRFRPLVADSDSQTSTEEYEATENPMPQLSAEDIKAKHKFTDKEDECIIEFIRDNELFYNTDLSEYHKPELKEKKLEELGQKLKLPGEYGLIH